ncbi:ferrochelatase [bacterium]|nr:ferrochelatase [bacterium]
MSSKPIGVLVAQLGTPDAPTAPALRRYLREFLGDPRVVDLNRVLWWFLLNGVILPFRPRRSAALYRNVWTDEGSPLLVISRKQTDGLRERLGDGFVVELGMRYGNPGIVPALERMLEQGVERIVVMSMFPQFSCATTGSVYDAVTKTLLARRNVPEWRMVRDYPTEPGYIRAIARGIRAKLGEDLAHRHLVISLHGIPMRYDTEGDPYAGHCCATACAIAEELQLPADCFTLAFQSQFGREQWLGPPVDEVLEKLAAEGKDVAICCPGFPADCLETIDEVGREYAHVFREAGGGKYTFVPCINDDDGWMDTMADLVRREAHGWLTP